MFWAILTPLLCNLPFWGWFFYMAYRPLKCSECGQNLSGFRRDIKKTWRQFFFTGGGTCPRCGCELDSLGNKVPLMGEPVGAADSSRPLS